MDSPARITVSPDSLADLAHAAAVAAPDPAALTNALAAGTAALAGLVSGAALVEVGLVWARQLDALQGRWQTLSREVSQARLDYAGLDAELAS